MSIDNYFLTGTAARAGDKVTTTRPNNVTAYAAGQVYGDAADARLEIVVPPLPTDALLEYVTAVVLKLVQHRDPAAAAPSFLLYLASEPFATQLGDGAPMVLSDADLERVVLTMSAVGGSAAFVQGAGAAGALANAANLNGRRMVRANAALESGMRSIVAGSTLGLYIALASAYTPIASEVLDIYPIFTTQSRIE